MQRAENDKTTHLFWVIPTHYYYYYYYTHIHHLHIIHILPHAHYTYNTIHIHTHIHMHHTLTGHPHILYYKLTLYHTHIHTRFFWEVLVTSKKKGQDEKDWHDDGRYRSVWCK